MRRLCILAAWVSGVSFLCGCTSYRYEVVSPDGGALAVKKDQDLVIPAPPAELRFRQVESRCVVLVANPSTQPFEIEAGGSALVDPAGQSRAIAGQLVPPASYQKYVLPPFEDAPPRGPQFQIGFGVLAQAAPSSVPSARGNEPRQAVYLSPGSRNMEYWEWNAAGEIRLILSLKQGQIPTKQEITLRRSKQ